jgi:hypothetical protein
MIGVMTRVAFLLRVALAQLCVHPAYDFPSNVLAEPCGDDLGPSELPITPEISAYHTEVLKTYVERLEKVIRAVLSECKKHHVQVLVFPEYSIPSELLPDLQGEAVDHDMCIVAGSHMVNERAISDYRAAMFGSDLINVEPGDSSDYQKAVSPVLLRQGVQLVWKNRPSMAIEKIKPDKRENRWMTVSFLPDAPAQSFQLGVKLCSDAICDPMPRGERMMRHLMVIPAYQSEPSDYHHQGELWLLNRTPLCFVNVAAPVKESKHPYGGTRLWGWVTDGVLEPFLQYDARGRHGSFPLPSETEALVIGEVDCECQSMNPRQIDAPSPLKIVAMPILCYEGDPVYQLHFSTRQSLKDDWTEYKRLAGKKVHRLVEHFMKPLLRQEAVLQDEEIREYLQFIRIADRPLWEVGYIDCHKALAVLDVVRQQDSLSESECQAIRQASEHVQGLIDGLAKSHDIPDHLKKVGLDARQAKLAAPPSLQGRESDIQRVLRFSSSPDTRLLLLQGEKGIGKTQFARVGLRQAFPSLPCLDLEVNSGMGFVRLLMSLARRLQFELFGGLAGLRDEALSSRFMDAVLERFDQSSRYLVIDEWQLFMEDGYPRDERLAEFVAKVIQRKSLLANKVVLVTRERLDETRLKTQYGIGDDLWDSAVTDLELPQLDDKVMEIIVENEIGLRFDERIPLKKEETIRRLRGNPGAAHMLVSILQNEPSNEPLDASKVAKRFERMLYGFVLNREDERGGLLGYLAVFDTPVTIPEIAVRLGSDAGMLVNRYHRQFHIERRGGGYCLRKLVKDAVLAGLGREASNEHHEHAAKVYETRIETGSSTDLDDKAEYVRHLADSGLLDKAAKHAVEPVPELRPAAIRRYEQGDTEQALTYFKMMGRFAPDAEIFAYQALCHARLGEHPDASVLLKKALNMQEKLWWAPAVYASILARQKAYHEVEPMLQQASSSSAKETDALRRARHNSQIAWVRGLSDESRPDMSAAKVCYKEALRLWPQHKEAAQGLTRCSHARLTPAAREHLSPARGGIRRPEVCPEELQRSTF